MRRLLATAVALAPLMTAAGAHGRGRDFDRPHDADHHLHRDRYGARRHPLATGGSIAVNTGSAVTVDSNNSIDLDSGSSIVMANSADGSTAILVAGDHDRRQHHHRRGHLRHRQHRHLSRHRQRRRPGRPVRDRSQPLRPAPGRRHAPDRQHHRRELGHDPGRGRQLARHLDRARPDRRRDHGRHHSRGRRQRHRLFANRQCVGRCPPERADHVPGPGFERRQHPG